MNCYICGKKLRETETFSGRPYDICVYCKINFIKPSPGLAIRDCPKCKGTGYVKEKFIVIRDVVCPDCKGIGKIFYLE